jgi:hypothetical protein
LHIAPKTSIPDLSWWSNLANRKRLCQFVNDRIDIKANLKSPYITALLAVFVSVHESLGNKFLSVAAKL